ncbi:hypothetical protein Nmel_008606 [Mimus melanotis]
MVLPHCRVFHELLPQVGILFLVMPKEPIIELSEAGDSGECHEFSWDKEAGHNIFDVMGSQNMGREGDF